MASAIKKSHLIFRAAFKQHRCDYLHFCILCTRFHVDKHKTELAFLCICQKRGTGRTNFYYLYYRPVMIFGLDYRQLDIVLSLSFGRYKTISSCLCLCARLELATDLISWPKVLNLVTVQASLKTLV